jgi:DNA-binding transcriptional ArsR family regulator
MLAVHAGPATAIEIFAQICKYLPMEQTETQEIANLLKALGEFNRLSLVYELCNCKAPQNAMCLCECCSVDASGVSRHLKILAQQGVVTSEKKGREISFSLNRREVAEKLRSLADKIEAPQSTP